MQDIRARILTAAARVYTEAGFRGATTRRVAQEAGVNEVTLFRHFGTKEALVRAALHLASSAPRTPLTQPRRPFHEVYQWALDTFRHWHQGRQLISRVLGDLIEHPELAPELCEEPSCEHQMLAGYLERMRAAGHATGPFHPEAAAGLLLGAVFTHAVWRDHFETPELPPAETVIREYVVLLFNAIGASGEIPAAGEAS
jgi:AcrR family transcriptional regulator